MDQPKQRKTVRLSPEGIAHIQQRADEADVDFSCMHRRMLAYAALQMPRGWVPPRPKKTNP